MAKERLQKLLAAAGLASRRAAEAWIREGRVRVDGRVAKLGDAADLEVQRVAVDGHPIAVARPAYWMAHKPRGVVTTTRDPEGRRTVLDLLPRDAPRLHPVGRLDQETEGLVLLTNDGAVTQALLHPSLGSEREYRVTVRGATTDALLRRLAAGIVLDDGPTAPARVGPARFDRAADASTFSLVLAEGRKRQIRRAMQALGHPVVRLLRVRMGPLVLGALAAGRARRLRPAEVAALRAHAARVQQRAARRQGGRSERAQVAPKPRKARRSPSGIDRSS
jgi:23S rRNA pseudouridine2605 synthase